MKANLNYTTGYKPQHPTVLAKWEGDLEAKASRLYRTLKSLEKREAKLAERFLELHATRAAVERKEKRVESKETELKKMAKNLKEAEVANG